MKQKFNKNIGIYIYYNMIRIIRQKSTLKERHDRINDIGLMSRLFVNDPQDWVSIGCLVKPKTQKFYLMPPC